MKYIEYLSDWKYSAIGINHSVFVKDGKVLSYEMSSTLWPGEYYLYDENKWRRSIYHINKEEELEDIPIEEYEWVEGNGICCFEALQNIAANHNITMPTLKERAVNITAIYLIIFVLLIISHVSCIILGFNIYNYIDDEYYDTIYYDNFEELCQNENDIN